MQTGAAVSEKSEIFQEAMLPHRSGLYRTARTLLGSSNEAEDAVQETYLQAWRCLERFEPGSNSRAWLFGILFNVARHHRRKWLQRVDFVDDPDRFEARLESRAELPSELEDPEILAALAAIPRHYADAVLMADVEEFDYKEIAAARAIPMGTVMSRVSRGRAMLRSRLAGFRSTGIPVCAALSTNS